jgi:PPOX class probable F420-dependent enzyme
MQLPADAVEAILERWPMAVLTTLGERGPHAVPVVFARAQGALWSPIDAKPKRGGELARVRHVRRDPRVALLLTHYDDDWDRLWWLRVDGEAHVRSARDAGSEAALAALRRKYPQYQRTGLVGPGASLLEIRIAAQRSWRASASATF